MVLEKFRVKVSSGWDSAGLLVEVEAELEHSQEFPQFLPEEQRGPQQN